MAPDGQHVAQTWVSICGAPGSTVTDLISVTNGVIARPSWDRAFAFIEDQGGESRDVSAFWVDNRHLQITVNALGDVHDSPNLISDVTVTYVLGPSVSLNLILAQKEAKAVERHQWERLKTSAAWSYVESGYDFDAYLIEHYQKFVDWARNNTELRP